MSLSKKEQIAGAERIFAGLMRRYTERVPDVKRIFDAMIKQGLISKSDEIENDHVAFRSLGVKHLGIPSLDRIFLHYGFEKKDHYIFENKHLDAYWYSPPAPHLPRIFMSELRVHELNESSREIIHRYTDTVTEDPISNINLNDTEQIDSYLHSSLWGVPTLEEYESLLEESEYAAWAIYNRYYLNHFTISVHSLPKQYSTLETFNTFIEKLGIKLNTSGGKIKISADSILKQSSTMAEKIFAEFTENSGKKVKKEIAGSFVEFAERLALPEFAHLPKKELKREHLRDGFEASNAEKIFDSTSLAKPDNN